MHGCVGADVFSSPQGCKGGVRYLDDPIERFEYQAGDTYKLLVRRSRVANPAADESSVRWRLIRVLEKTPVTQM